MPPALESEVLLARQRRVALDRLGEDLLGLGRAAPAVELDPLALLQVLVVLEEVADALEPVRADLGDVVDVAVAGEQLVDRNRQDLLVAAALVPPSTHADRAPAAHRAGALRSRQGAVAAKRVYVSG